jgi:hypothetical protein
VPFHKLKIALIADELTEACLSDECNIVHVTPLNYKLVFRLWRPDLFFVESAWHGYHHRWKFRIAAYPGYPNRTNKSIVKVAQYAKSRCIPTVFWNKEDSVHFKRFIDSAKNFDHIFTVDENCIERYRAVVAPEVTVNTLMFAAQSSIHCLSKSEIKYRRANFVGSYSRGIHPQRLVMLNMLLGAASAGLGLTVFDRNSARRSPNYRYPPYIAPDVRSRVSYRDTAQIYRDFMVSLNVNTITDSPTMFSRRLVEIFACGGLAVTTPALSIEKLFAPYCYTVHTSEEARELFARLNRDGMSAKDREMALAAADHVTCNHTWTQRLRSICETVGLA